MGRGDKLVNSSFNGDNVSCQAFITSKGKRLLLINQRNKEVEVNLPAEAKGALAEYVDVSTGENSPAEIRLDNATVTLKPFAVAVIELN